MSGVNDLLIRYRDLLSEVDTWFADCSLVAGKEISCRRGCSACCRGLFDITLLDARLLRDGFDQLESAIKKKVLHAAGQQLSGIRRIWPDFAQPYLLNQYPEAEWDLVMPEEDETPCPLLGEDGGCLVYASRPMTCRLNGIPMVDTSGELLFDEWCSLNFCSTDPLRMVALRFGFNDLFTQEQLLFREFTRRLFGRPYNELDSLIPAALLLDFEHITLPENLWSPSSS